MTMTLTTRLARDLGFAKAAGRIHPDDVLNRHKGLVEKAMKRVVRNYTLGGAALGAGVVGGGSALMTHLENKKLKAGRKKSSVMGAGLVGGVMGGMAGAAYGHDIGGMEAGSMAQRAGMRRMTYRMNRQFGGNKRRKKSDFNESRKSWRSYAGAAGDAGSAEASAAKGAAGHPFWGKMPKARVNRIRGIASHAKRTQGPEGDNARSQLRDLAKKHGFKYEDAIKHASLGPRGPGRGADDCGEGPVTDAVSKHAVSAGGAETWRRRARLHGALTERFVRNMARNHAIAGAAVGAAGGAAVNAGLSHAHNSGLSPYKSNTLHAAVRGGVVGGVAGGIAGHLLGHARAVEGTRSAHAASHAGTREGARASENFNWHYVHRKGPHVARRRRAADLLTHNRRIDEAHKASQAANAYWQNLPANRGGAVDWIRLHATAVKHGHPGEYRDKHERALRIAAKFHGFKYEDAIKHAHVTSSSGLAEALMTRSPP